ncbi:MAG: malto-oligosyltrehalose trehalohydrolase [Acidobacteria bacterium]|nr:malto-oligosyltrehalose trehalohydrolase [Acidobacteriota bacterium]
MPEATWRPTLGAIPGEGGTRFRVWAPGHQSVTLTIERTGDTTLRVPLGVQGNGYFGETVAGVGAGARYRYALDDEGPFPDPASRFQPEGVHGPSEIVDAARFAWTDHGWPGVALEALVIYELHVGTFTPEGTFRAAADRLPYLRDLGVTAVELMPVADFPGSRNWGYDGAALFAPARCYGTPDDLRGLVDTAHHLGLAVLLDVVYNHVGPDGAYLFAFSPWYFTDRHPSPWGRSVNLDGPHAAEARAFLVENALHWVHEYHADGLRLDATHAMRDDSAQPFLAELSARVHGSVSGRHVAIIAEDDRNLAHLVRPVEAGGLGLDAVWADDFHHEVRRALAGDRDGYYMDYSGTVADIATTIRQGWFYTGQHSVYAGSARGTDPSGIQPRRFVVCLQNHDQIGNRAFGDRLHHRVDLAAVRAVTVLLLTLPQTPLLFMGQEWAASSPFLYFTDHHAELGRLVTEGRRREFARFAAFSAPGTRERIPDPQSPSTFEASKLRWTELEHEPHAAMARLHRALLGLRQREPALLGAAGGPIVAEPLGAHTLVLLRTAPGTTLAIVVCLKGPGAHDLAELPALQDASADGPWHVLLTSESPDFAEDPMAPDVDLSGAAPVIRFERPSAVVLARAAWPE